MNGEVQKETGGATANRTLKAHGESEETKGRATMAVGGVNGKAKEVKNTLE